MIFHFYWESHASERLTAASPWHCRLQNTHANERHFFLSRRCIFSCWEKRPPPAARQMAIDTMGNAHHAINFISYRKLFDIILKLPFFPLFLSFLSVLGQDTHLLWEDSKSFDNKTPPRNKWPIDQPQPQEKEKPNKLTIKEFCSHWISSISKTMGPIFRRSTAREILLSTHIFSNRLIYNRYIYVDIFVMVKYSCRGHERRSIGWFRWQNKCKCGAHHTLFISDWPGLISKRSILSTLCHTNAW